MALIQFHFAINIIETSVIYSVVFAILLVWYMAMYPHADIPHSFNPLIVSFLLLAFPIGLLLSKIKISHVALSAAGLGNSFTLDYCEGGDGEWFGQNEIFELFFIATDYFCVVCFITYMLIKFYST